MIGRFDYSLFGLHLCSDLFLPELLEVKKKTFDQQVIIRLGTVPILPTDRPGGHFVDGGYLLLIGGVCAYLIRDGSEIVVDPYPGASDSDVRLFLLGSAMGALLHQRGLLPLHANAVEIEGRVFAFMGASGAGKSTLAAWFNDQGYRVMADDVCAIDFAEGGEPHVAPGVGRLRLWREILDLTGRNAANYQRSFTGRDGREKFDVPLVRPSSSDAAAPLAAIYLLDRSEGFEIKQLNGAAAVEVLFANTYRGGLVAETGNSEKHWLACISLVKSTPIFRVGRHWGLDRLAEQANCLLDHALQQ